MPLQPNGEFIVRTPAEWRLVGTATWVDIYSALGRGGSLTAQEIAARVGRTRQNIYFHLKKLEVVGLVKVVELRPAVRRPEAVFALVPRRVRQAVGRSPRPTESSSARQAVSSPPQPSQADWHGTPSRESGSSARASLGSRPRNVGAFVASLRRSAEFWTRRATRRRARCGPCCWHRSRSSHAVQRRTRRPSRTGHEPVGWRQE